MELPPPLLYCHVVFFRQVALRQMSEHLKTLSQQKDARPNLQLTRPVFEDLYR